MTDSRVLQRAGVVDEIRSQSWEIETVSWKKVDGDALVEMVIPDDGSPNRMLLYPVSISHLSTGHLAESQELRRYGSGCNH